MDEAAVESSLKASMDAVERIISKSSTALQKLRKLDADKSRLSNAETAFKVILVRNKIDFLDTEVTELVEECTSLDTPIVDVPWLEAERSKLDMTYVAGDNPWEFFLTYSNKEKLNEITEALKSRHHKNNLQKFVSPPEEGRFVVCHAGKKLFRAKILKCFSNGRFRILKIDSNEEGLVQSSDLYQVPQEIAAIPCQILRCCLNKKDQDLQERWCKELELILKKTLSECRLTIDILETLADFAPPKFYVRMYVYNDDIQEEINLSSWINCKLLADLKLISPDANDDIMAVLDEGCMDPFFSGRPKNGNGRVQHESTTLNPSYDPRHSPESFATDIPKSDPAVPDVESKPKPQVVDSCALIDEFENLDEPDPHLIGMSKEKVSTWMEQYTDEETIKSKKTIMKFEVRQFEEPSFSFTKTKVPLVNGVANVGVNGEHCGDFPLRSNNFTQSSYSSNASSSASTKMDVLPSRTKQKKSSSINSEMSVSAPEFVPSCYVEVTPGEYEESFENVISNLEDEYQPKDEKRICLFYRKKGFCNRTACTKEHISRTDRWTDDVVEIEKGPFNHLDLPREGSETILRVEHVENAISFFSTLHEIYSDTNEYGVRETLETLSRDLTACDSTSPHPLLTSMPAITEMLLALGLQRSLGPGRKWLRAVVTEILDTSTVEVFFVDFGNKEVVPVKDLRQIRPQFMHLPSQAVRTTLASIKIIPDRNRLPGKAFLTNLIKGKTLRAKIMTRDVFNGEIDVILYNEAGFCINDLMVDEGYCSPCN